MIILINLTGICLFPKKFIFLLCIISNCALINAIEFSEKDNDKNTLNLL